MFPTSPAMRLPLILLALIMLPSLAHAQAPTVSLPYVTHGTVPLMIDIYRPAQGTGPFPVVLWLHDGGWLTGDRTLPAMVLPLLDRGIAIASIDYRLTSEAGRYGAAPVTFPAQIRDVKGAIRWLRGHADGFNLDGRRIGVWGSSAGGHLAALAGTSHGVGDLEDAAAGSTDVSSRVQAVVDYYGPTDLLQIGPDQTTPPGAAFDHDAPTGPASLLIGYSRAGEGMGTLRRNAAVVFPPFPPFLALAQAANPITHVDALDAPTLIVHGTADNQVALRQSQRLHDALAAAGVPVELMTVAGGSHGGFPAAINTRAIDFLVAQLAGPTIAVGNPTALTGAFYEPSSSGQGFEFQWLEGDTLLLFFYGHRNPTTNLFLVGTRSGRPRYGETMTIALTETKNARFGGFDPATVTRQPWGTLQLTFTSCNTASAILDGTDGRQVLTLERLSGAPGVRCD